MVEQVVSELAVTDSHETLAVVPLSLQGTWMGAARRLRTLALQRGADVVLVHTDREHLVAAVAFRLGSRARVIRRVPAGRGLEMRRTGRVAAWLAATCYVFAAEQDVHSAPIPRGSTGRVVAPIGVEVVPQEDLPAERGEEPYGAFDIVCVQDASSRSRAATAIRTVAMLAPRHVHLRLRVMGEGAYDDDLRMQAAALGALQLVSFLGERADQRQVMRDARVGWVVADGDTAVYGILDFMTLGIPVIAGESSVAQHYVLSEITGMLVPPDDAFMTAAVVAELLTNDARRDMMGAAARARVTREFPEAEMIDGFERAAASATSRRRY